MEDAFYKKKEICWYRDECVFRLQSCKQQGKKNWSKCNWKFPNCVQLKVCHDIWICWWVCKPPWGILQQFSGHEKQTKENWTYLLNCLMWNQPRCLTIYCTKQTSLRSSSVNCKHILENCEEARDEADISYLAMTKRRPCQNLRWLGSQPKQESLPTGRERQW